MTLVRKLVLHRVSEKCWRLATSTGIQDGSEEERQVKTQWLTGLDPREIIARADSQSLVKRGQWMHAAGGIQLPALSEPARCQNRSLLDAMLAVLGRADSWLPLPLPLQGPVGFQSSNIAMAKGMFTSIGTVLGLLHDFILANASLQGAQSHTGHARLHCCTPSPTSPVPNRLSHHNTKPLLTSSKWWTASSFSTGNLGLGLPLPNVTSISSVSPEPGYYLDGEFGIRLEDVALVVEAKTKVKTGWREWRSSCGRDFGLHQGEEGQGELSVWA